VFDSHFVYSLCAFDSDTLLDLVDMPPAAPPPPMLPDASLAAMTIKRVMASGGLDNGLTITSALADCTDNGQTPCAALDYERPVRDTQTYADAYLNQWMERS
jgi:hypothetical protein